jgi:branched-chain amino acid transport system ATP-binding protein
MPVLETHNLVKRFGGLVAVDHVSLAVEEGEIFGIIGPNGAGKTTFINSIAGTHTPDGGQVVFLGQDTTGQRSNVMCRRGMSRTFQISQPFPKLTVLENVLVGATFGAASGGRSADAPKERTDSSPVERARQALTFVDFPMREGTRADHLNTVQLKRLDLARALACEPKLLLLDELAAGLTTGELGAVMDIIRKIRDTGVTIIIIEHIMKVIMGLCDRVAVIHYGRKIAQGTTNEVASNPKVLEAYLGEQHDF